jgi:hypothetical protein
LPTPEQVQLPKEEVLSPQGETASQGAAPQTIPLPQPIAPAPSTTDDDSDDQTTAKTSSIGPAIADDVDVIEKEWVDKAKAIVDEHKHDPYIQEREAGRLQSDYLKKRYGKDIKVSE